MNDADAIESTDRWLREVVIGEAFCPFAARPYADDEVYLEHSPGDRELVLLRLLRRARQMVDNDSPETALLIVTDPVYADFGVFLDLAERVEDLLGAVGKEALTLATFHPDYRFANLPPTDIAHAIHQSPWPLLHLLRSRSVAAVAAHHPEVDRIPAINRQRAAELGLGFFARYSS